MPEFIPPYPARPRQPLSAVATLRLARRNFLAIWEDRCFEWEVFSSRLLSRRVLVCNSPDTVAYAFVEHHDSFQRKSPQMRNGLAPLLGDGLFISDGETWRRRRPIVAPTVHISQMPLFAPLMVQAANETAERWARLRDGSSINALTEMAALTAEIICRTVFGRQLGAAPAADIIVAFTEYQRLVGQLDIAYFVGLPDWLPRFHSLAIRRAAKRLHGVLDRIIRDCRERLSDGETSMIRLLLEARDTETGEPLDDVALRNEAAVIFMAGHETTANSLAWTWYLLSQAPEVEERLHAELAGRRSRMFRSWSLRGRYSKKPSGFTRRCRCSPGRHCGMRRFVAVACRLVRYSLSCLGCFIVTASSGASPTISSPSGFFPKMPSTASATPIFRSASDRASAPAQPLARPRPYFASPRLANASGSAWRRGQWPSRCAD
jgi:cytochrome P450